MKIVKRLLLVTGIVGALILGLYVFASVDWIDDSKVTVPLVSPTPSPSGITHRLDSNKILELINKYRAENKLEPFTKSDELCKLASIRADYFIKDEMAAWKNSPDGSHPGIEEVRKMYSGKAMGENLGAFAKDNEQAAYGWKDSPTHNKNLLATGWNGVVVNKACVQTREIPGHNIIVLLVGDK